MTTSTEYETDFPTWVNVPPRLTGRQEPADESWFEGDENDGDRAAQLGARVGVKMFPWQWIALRKILSRNPDGVWTHPDAVTIATRQSGKSLVIILRILFGIYVLNERIVYSAQRWSSAEAIYKRLKAIIESRPSLQRRLAKDPTSSSSRAVIELRSGAIVALGVRSGDLGRGLDSVDLVVFDEAYNLTEVEVSALTGAQLASPNSQTIFASTPAVWEKHPNCQVLNDMRRLGQARQSDLYFAEWGAPTDLPRDDPETWRIASPSFGVIQKDRDVRRMLSKATTPAARSLFDADVLGWGSWPPDESELGTVIGTELWASMAARRPELVGPITIGVDRSNDRKTWSIAAASRTTGGAVHVEIGPYGDSWSNTEIVAKLLDIVCEWDPIAVVIDQRSAAAVLKPLLLEVEIDPVMTSAPELALACGGFLDSAQAGQISHSDQAALNDSVAAAIKRDLPGGGFAWTRTKTGGSVTPLVAATLGHWSLLTYGPAARPKWTPMPLSTARSSSDEFDDDRVPLDVMTAPF